jgi:hypothetical protein
MIRRLLADADLNFAIVAGVVRRNPEIDFKRAEEVPLEGLKDLAVLTVSAQEGRVLVSHDVSTMPAHLRAFIRECPSPGVILIPQELGVAKAIENVLLISEACDAPDLENRVCLAPSLVMYGF